MADDGTLSSDPWPLSPDRWIEPSARNLAEVFAGTAGRGGFRTARWDDAWAADLQSPEPIANSVTLLTPLTAGAAPELTARLDDFFGQGKGAGWILWSAWPTPDLASLGYTAIGEPPLMVRPAGGEALPAPNGLRIVEARNADALADFERVLIDGYPLPTLQPVRIGSTFGAGALGGPTRFLVGYQGSRPVTVAGACIDAGVVGLYFVATLAEARGRGYGAAVTDAAARVDPALPAVLQASDLGRPVYERLGFKTVSRYSLWTRARRL